MQDKRARKFIKRRIGTIGRAKRYVQPVTRKKLTFYSKMDILTTAIAEQRRSGH